MFSSIECKEGLIPIDTWPIGTTLIVRYFIIFYIVVVENTRMGSHALRLGELNLKLFSC